MRDMERSRGYHSIKSEHWENEKKRSEEKTSHIVLQKYSTTVDSATAEFTEPNELPGVSGKCTVPISQIRNTGPRTAVLRCGNPVWRLAPQFEYTPCHSDRPVPDIDRSASCLRI